jgi:hypothetical protein
MPGIARALMVVFAGSIHAAEARTTAGTLHDALELIWQAPEACPAASDVQAQIERLLGRTVPRASAESRAPVRVEARLSGVQGRFSLVLDVRDGSAERRREIEAPTCTELADVTALVVALVLNPDLEIAGEADTPRAASNTFSTERALALLACPVAPAGPAPTRPSSALPVCLPAARRELAEVSSPSTSEFWLGAGVGVVYGSLPRVTPRALLGVSYALASMRVELTAGFASAAHLDGSRDRGATFELWSVAPMSCYRALAGSIDGWACLGAELGLLRAEGFGTERSHLKRSFWLAPAAGALFAWNPSSGSTLLLGLEGLVPLTRTRFELAGAPVHRANAVVPAARLAVLLAVP